MCTAISLAALFSWFLQQAWILARLPWLESSTEGCRERDYDSSVHDVLDLSKPSPTLTLIRACQRKAKVTTWKHWQAASSHLRGISKLRWYRHRPRSMNERCSCWVDSDWTLVSSCDTLSSIVTRILPADLVVEARGGSFCTSFISHPPTG